MTAIPAIWKTEQRIEWQRPVAGDSKRKAPSRRRINAAVR